MRAQDQQSRVFYELCALLLSVLRSPPPPPHPLPISYSNHPPSSSSSSMIAPPPFSSSRRRINATPPQISPAGFASLLLGISMALMLCGSLTFVIGFILMPWVIGCVMVFYFVGIVSSLSVLGRAILCPAASPSPSPWKVS